MPSALLLLLALTVGTTCSATPHPALVRKEAQGREIGVDCHHQQRGCGEKIDFYGHVAVVMPQPPSTISLAPPSTQRYNLAEPSKRYFSQWGQEQHLWPLILKQMSSQHNRTPFFVEAGARDGEVHSNTLFLERSKGWQGLLVEPGLEYNKLLLKHRKAWSFHGGLSPTNGSANLRFTDTQDGLSHLKSLVHGVHVEPLHALLAKIKPPVTTVDYWSLDIEGSEGPVLEHTDFSKIEVGALMIEMNKNAANNRRIRAVMTKNGFTEVGGTRYPQGRLDGVFVQPRYFTSRGLPVPAPFGVV